MKVINLFSSYFSDRSEEILYSLGDLIHRNFTSSPPITPPSLWDRLPQEIAVKIFAKLCTADRVRASLVSKSWRETLAREEIPVSPEPPWRILSNDSYFKPEYWLTSEIRFKSSSEDRIYRFDLPAPGGQWWCCGSSNGWLLMARASGCMDRMENFVNAEIMLWNPISGSTRKLPNLSTLPFFREFVHHGLFKRVYSISGYIQEVQVFSVGSVECVVALVIVNPWIVEWHELVLCTPQDAGWSVVRREYVYKDVCFHNGRLYAFVNDPDEDEDQKKGQELNGRMMREANSYTVKLTGCNVEVDTFWFAYEPPNTERVVGKLGVEIWERDEISHRLVECRGELVIVSVVLDACTYSHPGCMRPSENFCRIQIGRFEVWKVSVERNSLEKVDSIGEEAIFVGYTSSFSLEASTHGVDGDCIYFATDDAYGELEDDELYVVREEGVFHVRENRHRMISSTILRANTGSSVGWFSPKLFQR